MYKSYFAARWNCRRKWVLRTEDSNVNKRKGYSFEKGYFHCKYAFDLVVFFLYKSEKHAFVDFHPIFSAVDSAFVDGAIL